MHTLLTVFVSTHLLTCGHIWQCLCPLLTVFVSTHLLTCRHFWQCLCPPISWHADTFWQCLCPPISWPADTFDSVCVHFWQCLCPPISWPADTFDCGPYCHLTTQHFLFLFSKNFVQGTIWYWCHYVVFQAAWQCHALHMWYLNLPMQQRTAEDLWTRKSPRKLQTEEQEINWLLVGLSGGDPVWLTGH